MIETVDYAHQSDVRKDGRRYVVTGMPPDAGIGFDPNGPSNTAFDELRGPLENEEEYIARVWVARESELPQLRADVHRRYPNLTDAEIGHMRPERFITTPEEIALGQLEAIAQKSRAMDDAHPDQPHIGTYVGHAPSVDFVAMAILGQEINLASFKAIEGLRKYLESSTLEIRGDEIVRASFRSRSLAVGGEPITIASIKERLQQQSDARKREWLAANG
jgi:hypothetical protein